MSDVWELANNRFPAHDVNRFLLWCVERKASDISFQTFLPVFMEVHGKLTTVTSTSLDNTDLFLIVSKLYQSDTGESILRKGKAIDCSYEIEIDRSTKQRFRINMSAVEARGTFGINITLRVLPNTPPSFVELGAEQEIVAAWSLCRGLSLMTGVPGSGKSTLMAAMTRYLLENGAGRIQSYESPIEYVFDDIIQKESFISQSEIPKNFETFEEGLRSSLRRRPAAIVVGEMRDRETIDAALNAADFGIAVYGTAHTTGVATTMRRLLSVFSGDEKEERASALVDSINIVISQVLVPNPKGGLTALKEWLVFNTDLKTTLHESNLAQWSQIITAEMHRKNNSIELSAIAAHKAGRISDKSLRRYSSFNGGSS